MIRLKGAGGIKDGHRKEAHKAFREEIYGLRTVGPGLLGALKTHLNGRLRNLQVKQRQKEALLLVVCYVLRVLLAFVRVLADLRRQDLGHSRS